MRDLEKIARENAAHTARSLAVSAFSALGPFFKDKDVVSINFSDEGCLFVRRDENSLTIHLFRIGDHENEADAEPEGESSPNPSGDEGA